MAVQHFCLILGRLLDLVPHETVERCTRWMNRKAWEGRGADHQVLLNIRNCDHLDLVIATVEHYLRMDRWTVCSLSRSADFCLVASLQCLGKALVSEMYSVQVLQILTGSIRASLLCCKQEKCYCFGFFLFQLDFFSSVTEVLLFIMPTSMSHGELRSWKSAGEGLQNSRKESRNGSKTVVFHSVIEAYWIYV